MKTFFILGRNPQLSRLEISSYLTARKINFEEVLFQENFLILNIPDSFDLNIQELGGVIKVGKILFNSPLESEFDKFLDKNELIPEDKFSYSVFGNGEPDKFKEKFKIEKKKAVLKHGRENIKFQGEVINRLPKSKYSLFLFIDKSNIYFGIVDKEYDYHEVERRDMEKPIRRESLAISPRLSKILINLSQIKQGETLLDPFCGIGGIIQEALIQGVNCVGIDKDKLAIDDAKKNISWLKQTYKIDTNCILQNLDAKNTPDNQFDAIATETPLGILLTKRPTDQEAKEIIRQFEIMITPILQRLKKVKKPLAKIAITFPVVKSLRVNSRKVAKESSLRIISGPIIESRPDQFISREILVLE